MNTPLRIALATLAAALSPLAFAHASLVDSFPAKGQTVTGSPAEIHLTFNEHVEARYCRIKLVSDARQELRRRSSVGRQDQPEHHRRGGAGAQARHLQRALDGGGQRRPQDARRLLVHGRQVARAARAWTTPRSPRCAPRPPRCPTSASPRWPARSPRWRCCSDTSSDWATRCVRRCRRAFVRAAWLALAASLAWMGAQALAMTDGPPLRGAAWPSATSWSTRRFGRAWAVATLALAARLALAGAAPRPRAAAAHARAGAAGDRGRRARVRGPRGRGRPGLARADDGRAPAGHRRCGPAACSRRCCAWLRGAPDAVDGPRYARAAVQRRHRGAGGGRAHRRASAWHGLGGSLAPLAPHRLAWGVALDVKLVLVAAAVALGAFNRFVVLPALPARLAPLRARAARGGRAAGVPCSWPPRCWPTASRRRC